MRRTSQPFCLGEVTDDSEKPGPGFRRLALPLSESDESQGVFLGHLVGQISGQAENSDIPSVGKTITVDLPEVDVQRWKLLSQTTPGADAAVRDALSDRIRNLPRLNGIRNGMPLYIGLAVTGFLYGGLHGLAWNAPFATRLEKLLWRISSVAILSTFVLVLLFYSWEVSSPIWQNFDESVEPFKNLLKPFDRLINKDGWRKWTGRLLGYPLAIFLLILRMLYDISVIAAAALYCVARVYLVVECFLNLAHLPDSVYQVPIWSQYVPHIS